MSQVFTGDDHVVHARMPTHPVVPAQAHPPAGTQPPVLGPAMTPGKGVRRIRCCGCSQATLPRSADLAPLCQRCSELLASAGPAANARVTGWSGGQARFRTPRWLRRRSALG